MNYNAMTEPQLLEALGTDARKWAEAFCAIYEQSDPPHAIEVEWLTTWFANAIEAGRRQ